MSHIFRSLVFTGCTCIALLMCAATAQAQQQSDPPTQDEDAAPAPGRVARLAYLTGQVQFAPAGEDDWGSVEINRPMVIGDRLLTGDDGRAALELGEASIRLDHGSAFDFLNLDENNVQIELSQGTLNLAVRDLGDGENFEVDTPTIAFVATAPGTYRIDDNPTGTGSMVTVFRGSGVVYGENGASRDVAEGTSYRFNDSTLTSVDVNGLPEPDDFDRFCETRDANHERYASEQQQYVPPEMIGGDDLYQYGQWDAVPEYGNVWYPRSVPVGWAPYRYGHWAWIDPWGWTWVDNQPWGFAPFHYGRWVYVRSRWGWVPGPVNVRPVYAPALVAFVGGPGTSLSIRVGGGGPVGWFPLGPRDVYVPWFHASRGYFTNVNVTNIRRVYVNRGMINNFYDDYRHQRYTDIHRRNQYRYRDQPNAVTMVPRTIFANARPVHPAALKLDPRQLRNVRVAVRPDVNPGKASLGLHRPAARPAALHGREPFARPVVARHAPPPRPVNFAAREKIIASQHGQPLTTEQMRNLRRSRPASETRNERVKLVTGAPRGAPVAKPIQTARPRPNTPSRPEPPTRGIPTRAGALPHPPQAAGNRAGGPHEPPFRNTVQPIPARGAPTREAPLRAGELPSARFRPAQRTATLPRPAAIRPAGNPENAPPAAGRLPVVRPLESAPRSLGNRTGQPQRQSRIEAQQHVPAQRPQQQRQQQQQQDAQLRVRAQQDQKRTAAQQEHAREQQVQQQSSAQEQVRQQREAQIQSQQRARAQQVQQQRQVQQTRMLQTQQVPREVPQRTPQRPQERYVPRAIPPPPPKQHQERPTKKPPASSSGNPLIR